MKKHLLLWALLPLIVTAQSTQRIEADNILLQTRTPQISNTNVTVNGSIKITAVANGSSTDSVLVVANGTLKRIARSAFSEFVSKTNADTITAFKWFTRKVILDSMYGTIYNGILNNALVKYNIGFVRPEGGTVTSYLAASTSSFGGPRNYHLPSRYSNDTLLCQGDSNLYATKSDISTFPTTSSVNAALALKENTITASNTSGRYWNGYKVFAPLNTDSITEGSKLFYTDARARAANADSIALRLRISDSVLRYVTPTQLALKQNTLTLTTTGSGAATLNSSTGALNIPISSGGTTTGTYAQRIAIASPSVGQQFYQTDELEGNYIYNGSTWQRDATGLEMQENFNSATSSSTALSLGYFTTVVSGTGATTGTGGALNLNTGTTTTGFASFRPTQVANTGSYSFILANELIYYECFLNVVNLSDATDTYVLKTGWESNIGSSSSSGNTGFRYTHSESSGQWTFQYHNSAGTTTNISTGVTVAANTAYKLGIKIQAPANTATQNATIQVYVNGTLTNTLTQRIANMSGLFPTTIIIKTAGTTNRITYLDYIKYYKLR